MLQIAHAPPVFTALHGRVNLLGDEGVSTVVMCQRGLFDPGEPFALERTQAGHCICGREGLVIVDHDRDIGTGSAANSADDGEIFLERGIADFRFNAFKASASPILRYYARSLWSVVAHGTIRRYRSGGATEQAHQ